MPHTLDKSKARVLTRVAQAAAVVLLLAAVGVGAVGLPGRADGPGELVVPEVKPTAGAAQGQAAQQADVTAAAERLLLVSNSPKPVQTPTTADPGSPGTAPAPMAEFKYLGPVDVGALRMALVVDNGRQRFVRVGQQANNGEVERIDDAVIVIAGREYQKATKADAVTFAAAGPSRGGGRSGGISNDEMKQYLADKRPEVQTRWQEIREALAAENSELTEEELNQHAAKLLEQEAQDPDMAKRRNIESMREGRKRGAGGK